ncbi:MAG: V-type ATP synthase subunit D, partial [Spirochaetales bacterium]|nr:V-type ATP synthase subunit D [Spirochaetales bacterium]
MATIKLTKNELKSQKDALKRFQRYLPTLILKKQQLQMVIRQVEMKISEVEEQRNKLYNSLQVWIAVYGESIDLIPLIKIASIVKDMGNIAGVDIPVFRELFFKRVEYDLYNTPLWI